MRSLMILLIIVCMVHAVHGQVTPFTGGAGSGAAGTVSASISCPLFFGGIAAGGAVNKTLPIVCAMFFGGAGDGADAAQSHCEELLTEGAGVRATTIVAAGGKGVFSEETMAVGGMTVYPNPASGMATLRIQTGMPVRTQIMVMRADGMVVQVLPVQLAEGVNRVPLDLSHLASGMYVIYNRVKRERVKVLVR